MKHALNFSSAQDVPELLVRENSCLERLNLAGEQNISFSQDKFCIGYKSDGEQYKKCMHGAMHTKQCPRCASKDIARVYTVGDFSLYPHLKEKLDCEKYIIYLAQFGTDITKVGLTRRSRYEMRWREQGADMAIALLEFDGPDDAYPAEQYLQNLHGFAGAVRSTQKIKRLNFDKNKARRVLEEAAAKVNSDSNTLSYQTGEKIIDLTCKYPKVSNPEIVDYVNGQILGAKGQWLFCRGASGLDYACNMSKQIGSFLAEGKNI